MNQDFDVQLLWVILNETEKLNDLLVSLEEHGITGGTIIDSTGMAKLLYHNKKDLPFFGSLYMLMNDGRQINKTILMVLNKEKVETAKQIVHDITGGMDHAGSGIMFTIPVLSVEGLR
ncbi:MAG: hypothetical protein CR988_04715 [Treponema sp.]|nr:MAG: hypothetical protein CR988_04715 [Treponema sp.]